MTVILILKEEKGISLPPPETFFQKYRINAEYLYTINIFYIIERLFYMNYISILPDNEMIS